MSKNFTVTERKVTAFKEGEINCLGLCMKNKGALNKIVGSLTVEDFYWESHQHIYQAILNLVKSNEHVDVLTVGDALGKQGLLEAAKGQSYLSTIFDTALDPSQSEFYAQKVRDWSMLRKITETNEKIIATINNGDVTNPLEIIGEQSKELHNISVRFSNSDISSFSDLSGQALDYYTEAHFSEDKSKYGHPTGFPQLDAITGGLQNNDYIVVAGRSNTGKTAYGIFLACYIAKNEKLPVLIFSLETNKEKIMGRIIAMVAGVNASKMREGKLSEEDFIKVTNAIEKFKDVPILISTKESTMVEIKSKSMEILNEYGKLGAVLIDYIDLIEPPHFRNEGHAQLADVSKQLAKLKNQLDCPLIVIAQLNRNADNRSGDNKRPIPTDIGGSDRIYRDCDVCLMLYDPNPVQQASHFNDIGSSNKMESKIIEVIVSKQRKRT